MNSKWIALLFSLATLALGGCASMNGDQCLTSDWKAIGFEDGSRGYSASRLGNHRAQSQRRQRGAGGDGASANKITAVQVVSLARDLG